MSVIGLQPGDQIVVTVLGVGEFGGSELAQSNPVVVPGGGVRASEYVGP